MKCTVDQAALKRAIATVLPATSRKPKPTPPVIGHVLLAATADGELHLTATDLELGMSSCVPATVNQPGSYAVPARLLRDVTALLPKDSAVTLTGQGVDRTPEVMVEAGTVRTTLTALAADEYPAIPTLADTAGHWSLTFKVIDLRDAIKAVAWAAARGEMRPALRTVQIEAEGSTARLAATDGFIMAISKLDCEPTDTPRSVTIPATTMDALARILVTIRNPEDVVTIWHDPGLWCHINIANVTITTMAGREVFPPVHKIVGRTIARISATAEVDRAEFLRATRLASLFNSAHMVRLSLVGNWLVVAATADLIGVTETGLVANVTGDGDRFIDQGVLLMPMSAGRGNGFYGRVGAERYVEEVPV